VPTSGLSSGSALRIVFAVTLMRCSDCRSVLEFLGTVDGQRWVNYAAVSSGMATSSGSRLSCRMECSLK
jgi:hypothetical protein